MGKLRFALGNKMLIYKWCSLHPVHLVELATYAGSGTATNPPKKTYIKIKTTHLLYYSMVEWHHFITVIKIKNRKKTSIEVFLGRYHLVRWIQMVCLIAKSAKKYNKSAFCGKKHNRWPFTRPSSLHMSIYRETDVARSCLEKPGSPGHCTPALVLSGPWSTSALTAAAEKTWISPFVASLSTPSQKTCIHLAFDAVSLWIRPFCILPSLQDSPNIKLYSPWSAKAFPSSQTAFCPRVIGCCRFQEIPIHGTKSHHLKKIILMRQHVITRYDDIK